MTGEEFKQRFLPMSGKLYAVALSLTCDKQEAEDVVQDTYLRLWTRRDTLPDMDNAEAYCITLARHLCHDRLRNRHNTHEERPAGGMQATAPTDIETEVERRNDADIIKAYMARLPERQRAVVTMRDVEGLGYEEIGLATGLEQTNIRVALSRARKTLREQFNAIRNYGNKGY